MTTPIETGLYPVGTCDRVRLEDLGNKLENGQIGRLTDEEVLLLGRGMETDSLNVLELAVITPQEKEQIFDILAMMSTDAERIAAFNNLLQQMQSDDDDLQALINNSGQKTKAAESDTNLKKIFTFDTPLPKEIIIDFTKVRGLDTDSNVKLYMHVTDLYDNILEIDIGGRDWYYDTVYMQDGTVCLTATGASLSPLSLKSIYPDTAIEDKTGGVNGFICYKLQDMGGLYPFKNCALYKVQVNNANDNRNTAVKTINPSSMKLTTILQNGFKLKFFLSTANYDSSQDADTHVEFKVGSEISVRTIGV